MNTLDIIILIILAFSIIKGLLQGFLKGISSLVAILVGLLLAKRYYLPASAMLVKFHIPDPKGLTGYLVVFLLFYLGIKLIFFLLQRLSKRSGLTAVDRVLGCLLGFLKGSLYVLLLVTLVQVAFPKNSAFIIHAKLLPYSNKVLSYTKGLIPQGFQASLMKSGLGKK